MPKERSEKEIKNLAEISSLINSSLEITEVLNNAMDIVEELLDAETSSIFEIDLDSNELFFRLARGEGGDKIKEFRFKIGEGIAGWVARSGESLLVPDVEKDERFSVKLDNHTGFKTSSMIAVPIKNKGRITGVLEVLNKRKPDKFDQEDLEVLTIIANHIGTAIENAKLYARLQNKFVLTKNELRKAQEKLIRSERVAAMGQLSQGIAHEVRNPVMSIGGFARRLKKKLEPDNILTDYVDIILKETSRLEKMVKDVERYSSMPQPKVKEVKLESLLNKALTLWEKEHSSSNVKINLKPMPDNPYVFVDAEMMIRVFNLLWQNAEEAMPNGGVVSTAVRWVDEWLVISIKDNGEGISEEDLPRIFDPFFTSKPQGAGLGLTIVNRIVSDHGGDVKVTSNPGIGTEFKIFLPLNTEYEL